jgi:hypothetical protein
MGLHGPRGWRAIRDTHLFCVTAHVHGEQALVLCRGYGLGARLARWAFRDAQGRLINVWSVEIVERAQVRAIRSIINPNKLRHLAPISELALLS